MASGSGVSGSTKIKMNLHKKCRRFIGFLSFLNPTTNSNFLSLNSTAFAIVVVLGSADLPQPGTRFFFFVFSAVVHFCLFCFKERK